MFIKTSAFACISALAVLAPAARALPFGMPSAPGHPTINGLDDLFNLPVPTPPHGILKVSERIHMPPPPFGGEDSFGALQDSPFPSFPSSPKDGLFSHFPSAPKRLSPPPFLSASGMGLGVPGMGAPEIHPNTFLPSFHFTQPNELGHIEIPGMDCMSGEEEEKAEPPQLKAFVDTLATGNNFIPMEAITISVTPQGVTIQIPEDVVCEGGPTGGMCLIHVATTEIPSPGHVVIVIQ